ncbi:MAG TPA: CdaR family protein [Gemmataceae bacterium]|jgi:hypothetical protein|nr:CdaR family protein [Gemmataceae bacterium]
MVDRLISCLMALSLAFLVWLYARGREQESVDNVPIPVQLALAPGQEERYDLEITGPSQVLVSFTGAPSRIRELRGMLQRGEIRVGITLAVPEDRQTESRFRDTVRIEAADVPVPPGVTAVVLEGRNRVPVALHRLIERRLPVRFDATPAEEIGQVTVEPATVRVRGPQEILERVRAVPTQLYSLPQAPDSAPAPQAVSAGEVPLVRELEGRALRVWPHSVRVRFTTRPRQKLYQLTDVPVQFLCPANFALRPHFVDERDGKITLRLTGPAADSPPAVAAFIDLTGPDIKAGLYAEEPVKFQLPKDFQLAQDPPRSRPFQLVATDVATKGAPEHGDGPRAAFGTTSP